MPRIPQNIEQRIKDACHVLDFIQEDGFKVHRNGVNWTCLCPFHADRHIGSFVIDGKRDRYTCFSCDAGGDSLSYLTQYRKMTYPEALRYAASKYGIYIDDAPLPPVAHRVKPHTPPPPLPVATFPMQLLIERADLTHDTLVNWLRSLPWAPEQAEWINNALCAYMIAHARQGHTIFPQIEADMNLRTAKFMLYKPDGHRDKETPRNFTWLHKMMEYKTYQGTVWYNPDEMTYKTTLFGLHMLNVCPDATINIVESEKTALIMSIAQHDWNNHLWMACGSKHNLTEQKLHDLIAQRRNIICYPDRDGIAEWREMIQRLDYDRITVNTQMMDKYWTEADGPKADIADIVIRRLYEAKQDDQLKQLTDKHPYLGEFINKLKLQRV